MGLLRLVSLNISGLRGFRRRLPVCKSRKYPTPGLRGPQGRAPQGRSGLCFCSAGGCVRREQGRGRMRTSDGGLSELLGTGATDLNYTTAGGFRARAIR